VRLLLQTAHEAGVPMANVFLAAPNVARASCDALGGGTHRNPSACCDDQRRGGRQRGMNLTQCQWGQEPLGVVYWLPLVEWVASCLARASAVRPEEDDDDEEVWTV
jgi:hypothetical protein